MTSDSLSTQIRSCLVQYHAGNRQARNELLKLVMDRLERLTRRMLKQYRTVDRWEDTVDVLQNSLVRLCRALDEAQVTDSQHFFRLAALQIRREMMDLTRHYSGPLGLAANHISAVRSPEGEDPDADLLQAAADPTHDAESLRFWTEFHEKVELLPLELRMVFDLLWYNQLTQEEAADILGVNVRTIKRRWQQARLALQEMMDSPPPI